VNADSGGKGGGRDEDILKSQSMRHLSLPFPSFSRGKSAEYEAV